MNQLSQINNEKNYIKSQEDDFNSKNAACVLYSNKTKFEYLILKSEQQKYYKLILLKINTEKAYFKSIISL